MNNFKNLLILTLTALLGLSLFTVLLQTKHTHPAPSSPKTYDAVKLLNYEKCLDSWNIRLPISQYKDEIAKEIELTMEGKKTSRQNLIISICAPLLK